METLHWDDIDVSVELEKQAVSLGFRVYEITGRSEGLLGLYDVRHYEKKGAASSEDETKNLSEAQTLVHGYIKWDACSHVYFGDEDGYIHMCGKHSWELLQTVLKRVFVEAGKRLKEGHNDDFFPKESELV